MTSYNGKEIKYDSIGNPVSVGSDTYSWQNGRELASSTISGKKSTYTYDSNGLRVSKIANGVTSKYLYDGDQLVYEQRGDNDIFYFYNADGQVTGIQYNGANYYFTFNLRGDIIGIYNGAGDLKGSYEYNEWGDIVSITDSAGKAITDVNSIVLINPIRYRGYYYDTETGLFYVGSRYYNPEWGRFLNADDTDTLTATPMELTDKNLFAYCDNNPIMRSDNGGDFWFLAAAVGAVAGAAFSVGWQMIVEKKSIKDIDWVDVGTSAISGALAATGLGVGWQVGLNAVLGGGGKAMSGGDIGDIAIASVAGGVSGALGGNGANYKGVITKTASKAKRLIAKQKGVGTKYARKAISRAKSEAKAAYQSIAYTTTKNYVKGSSVSRVGYYGYNYARYGEAY